MARDKATNKEWLKSRSKTRTGFCGNGQCEGDRPKNFKGQPLPTCKFWNTCPCQCHFELDEMYKLAGMERDLVDNPEYTPDRGSYIMPDPLEVLAEKRASTARRTNGYDGVEVEPITLEGALVGKGFIPTPSGRRSRGQLEYQVLAACIEACRDWMGIIPMTPKTIGQYISQNEGIEPPSTGAIQSVWERWKKMEFAEYEKKPVRFVGFTGREASTPPSIEDLDKVKFKFKRTERMDSINRRRGVPR